jgi:spore germination protein (amino acid permease)
MWPTVINYASGMAARLVGRDMWISGVFSVISTLVFTSIIIYIGRKFPGKTIVEYGKELLSTIPGKLLGLLLTIYFFVYATNILSTYIHHLTDFLLPETPFMVVTVLQASVIYYLVWKGPEVIARVSVIGFAFAILVHILVFLASLSEVDFGRLTPLFDSGFPSIFKAGLLIDTFIGMNQFIVAMFLPMVLNQKKAMRSAVTGLSIGGGFFVFFYIAMLMVMGPQVIALVRIASMDYVRSIQITQYLHRFESFMVALWYWSILVQASTLAYCSIKAFIQTIGIRNEKGKKMIILYIIYGIGTIALSYFTSYDRVWFINFREYTWQYIALPIQYGIPIILLFSLILKKILKRSKS